MVSAGVFIISAIALSTTAEEVFFEKAIEVIIILTVRSLFTIIHSRISGDTRRRAPVAIRTRPFTSSG
jgi:hypothetical protein